MMLMLGFIKKVEKLQSIQRSSVQCIAKKIIKSLTKPSNLSHSTSAERLLQSQQQFYPSEKGDYKLWIKGERWGEFFKQKLKKNQVEQRKEVSLGCETGSERSIFITNLSRQRPPILIITPMANRLPLFVVLAVLALLANAQNDQCSRDTFKIQGTGQIYVIPDIAILTISASGSGASASIALANLNAQVAAVVLAFQNRGIPMGNYSTSTITIYNTYNYNTNPYTITGSQATQTLTVTIGAATNLAALLTTLNGIAGVSVNYVQFDLLNRSAALQKARLAAFADAKNKFNQYLSLSGEKNLGLLRIQDLNSDVYTVTQYTPSSYALLALLKVAPSPIQAVAGVAVTWRVNG